MKIEIDIIFTDSKEKSVKHHKWYKAQSFPLTLKWFIRENKNKKTEIKWCEEGQCCN